MWVLERELDALELRRRITVIRARFPLVIVSVLLAAGTAFVASSVQPKAYEARATLIVGQSLSAANPDFNQLLVSQRLSTTYAAVATTRPTLESVIQRLQLGITPDELSKRIRANAPLDSTLLTITAQDVDPSRAAAIANALAEGLIAASPAIQGRQAEFAASIDADLKATQAQMRATQVQVEALSALPERTARQQAELDTLEARLVSLRSTYATLLSYSSGNASNLLTILEPAIPPIEPTSPKPLLNVLVAAVASLLLAAGLIALAEHLDDGIRDSDAVMDATRLSTLGRITRMKGERGRGEIYRLATMLYPRSEVAEAYRTLRTNIEFASVDSPIRTLLVTSSVPGEGKTVTAANLAVVFAQAGRQVLLVDADLRRPGGHVIFDLPNTKGLSTLLRSDECGLDDVARATEQQNLRIVTAGPLPLNPAELLGSQRMRTTVDRFKAAADLVIFDSPPLEAFADASQLSSFLDGTILVIDAGRSRRGAVRQAREALAKADANVLGAVLNRVPRRAQTEYADYYRESYGTEGTDKTPTAAIESETWSRSPNLV